MIAVRVGIMFTGKPPKARRLTHGYRVAVPLDRLAHRQALALGPLPQRLTGTHFSVPVIAASRSAIATMTRSARSITRRSRSSRALRRFAAISRDVPA